MPRDGVLTASFYSKSANGCPAAGEITRRLLAFTPPLGGCCSFKLELKFYHPRPIFPILQIARAPSAGILKLRGGCQAAGSSLFFTRSCGYRTFENRPVTIGYNCCSPASDLPLLCCRNVGQWQSGDRKAAARRQDGNLLSVDSWDCMYVCVNVCVCIYVRVCMRVCMLPIN